MYNIEVHSRISQICSLYYFFGVWHGEDRSAFFKRFTKIWYLCLYGVYPIVLTLGAINSKNKIEFLFLMEMAIPASVITIRMCYLIWKKDEILEFIRMMGAHSIRNRESFNVINKRINIIMHLASIYHFIIAFALFMLSVLAIPIFSKTRSLPLNIYFPLDWRGNVIAYWIAFIFVVHEFVVSILFTTFNIFLWYLMMSCVIKYQVLGEEFKYIGSDSGTKAFSSKKEISVTDDKDLVLAELIALIKDHKNLQHTTDQLKLCFSNLFLVQIGTSGMAICGSVYILAFSSPSENIILYCIYSSVVMYQFFDIYLVTYFGNEIKFWSSRLSYRLFECNWIDQSKLFKQCMVILMEVLKQPQVLVIGKLYSLDLEIFTNILNFAYSTFNILKNMN